MTTARAQCPKCPGKIIEDHSKPDESYGWCTVCKGIWISLDALKSVFRKFDVVSKLRALKKKFPTKMSCPDCGTHLETGRFENSELDTLECQPCVKYFFGKEELNALLDLLNQDGLPRAKPIKYDESNLIATNEDCPICENQPLWAHRNFADRLKVCIQCEGMLTQVEVLNQIAKRSLFGPSMFTFRSERGEVALCRHCHTEQAATNESCVKCGRPMSRVPCQKCNGLMSEYALHDLTIDRCQVCNSVWLDPGEFERVLTAFPDVRKRYEDGRRKAELSSAVTAAGAFAVGLNIDQSRRKIIDRFWGRLAALFYERF